MKKDTHPTFFVNATVTCACGESYTLGSTIEKQETEICRACHPFFTGSEKVIDSAGRVEKFKARMQKATSKKTTKKATKKA